MPPPSAVAQQLGNRPAGYMPIKRPDSSKFAFPNELLNVQNPTGNLYTGPKGFKHPRNMSLYDVPYGNRLSKDQLKEQLPLMSREELKEQKSNIRALKQEYEEADMIEKSDIDREQREDPMY